jgi:hypothetical protein
MSDSPFWNKFCSKMCGCLWSQASLGEFLNGWEGLLDEKITHFSFGGITHFRGNPSWKPLRFGSPCNRNVLFSVIVKIQIGQLGTSDMKVFWAANPPRSTGFH